MFAAALSRFRIDPCLFALTARFAAPSRFRGQGGAACAAGRPRRIRCDTADRARGSVTFDRDEFDIIRQMRPRFGYIRF